MGVDSSPLDAPALALYPMAGLTKSVLQNLHSRVATLRAEATCSVEYNSVTIADARKGMISIDPDMALSGMFSAYQFSVWFLTSAELGEVKPNRVCAVDGVEYGIIRADKDPYDGRWQLDLRAIDG